MISRVAAVTLVFQHRRVKPNPRLELLTGDLWAEADPCDHPGVGEDQGRDSGAADGADIRGEVSGAGLVRGDRGPEHRLLLHDRPGVRLHLHL